MEKTLVENNQQAPQELPAQPGPAAIHRKPLPVASSAHAHGAATTIQIESTTDPEKTLNLPVYIPVAESKSEPHSQGANLHAFPQPSIPYESKHSYNAPLPPIPPYRSTPVRRLQTQWRNLKKRTRYLILGAVLVVLVLIIGLAAGISSRSNKFSNLPLPNSHGGPYTGDLTYYDPGLGACGITSTGKDFIVAVSHLVFDAVQTGSNPNANPLCGKKIRANRNGRSVDLTVVDRCTGCQPKDIDVTRTVFEGLANIDQGRVPVTWAWLENVPGGATGS